MKIIEKKRYSNGRRHVYFLGMKILSYKRGKTRVPKRHLLYRFFTYPLAVYNEYKYLKQELKKMK